MKHFYFYFFFFTSLVIANQSKWVVKDEFGEPVAFANVFFKDSNEGTITNENGRFI